MKKTIAIVLAVAAWSLLTLSAHAATTKSTEPSFETKPGPAFQMVEGKLNKIDGNVYVVEDYTGKEVKMFVSKETKKIRGEKKPGDAIRAEVTKGWHANSIQ